jgi:hypothetical protein
VRRGEAEEYQRWREASRASLHGFCARSRGRSVARSRKAPSSLDSGRWADLALNRVYEQDPVGCVVCPRRCGRGCALWRRGGRRGLGRGAAVVALSPALGLGRGGPRRPHRPRPRRAPRRDHKARRLGRRGRRRRRLGPLRADPARHHRRPALWRGAMVGGQPRRAAGRRRADLGPRRALPSRPQRRPGGLGPGLGAREPPRPLAAGAGSPRAHPGRQERRDRHLRHHPGRSPGRVRRPHHHPHALPPRRRGGALRGRPGADPRHRPLPHEPDDRLGPLEPRCAAQRHPRAGRAPHLGRAPRRRGLPHRRLRERVCAQPQHRPLPGLHDLRRRLLRAQGLRGAPGRAPARRAEPKPQPR